MDCATWERPLFLHQVKFLLNHEKPLHCMHVHCARILKVWQIVEESKIPVTALCYYGPKEVTLSLTYFKPKITANKVEARGHSK